MNKEIKIQLKSADFEFPSLEGLKVKIQADVLNPNTAMLDKLKSGKVYKLVEDDSAKYIYIGTGDWSVDYSRLYNMPWIKANPLANQSYCKGQVREEKNSRVMFNGKATILQFGKRKIVVKCHKGDKFDYKTGLGLALYRLYQHTDKKEMKWLNSNLDYKKLAEYCLLDYYEFDKKKLAKWDKPEQGKWLEL